MTYVNNSTTLLLPNSIFIWKKFNDRIVRGCLLIILHEKLSTTKRYFYKINQKLLKSHLKFFLFNITYDKPHNTHYPIYSIHLINAPHTIFTKKSSEYHLDYYLLRKNMGQTIFFRSSFISNSIIIKILIA